VEEWAERNEKTRSNAIRQLGRAGTRERSEMAITPLSILARDMLGCLRNDRATGDSTLYTRIAAEKVPAVLGAICQIFEAERQQRLTVEPQEAEVLTRLGEEILACTN
jgi:hypothetical protein